tara:strand:- start:5 stop:247 length:243 start_codon:yes stop_codon:yes gene_type:complete
MEKKIVVNEELYSDKVLDNNGNVISLKKRVNDFKIIKHLLSSKSKHKLSLKQYRFLMQMQANDTCTPNQRDWLQSLYIKS